MGCECVEDEPFRWAALGRFWICRAKFRGSRRRLSVTFGSHYDKEAHSAPHSGLSTMVLGVDKGFDCVKKSSEIEGIYQVAAF